MAAQLYEVTHAHSCFSNNKVCKFKIAADSHLPSIYVCIPLYRESDSPQILERTVGLLSNLRISNLIRFDAKSNRIELRIQIRIRVESNNNFVCSIRFDSSKRRGFLFIIAIWAL